MLIENGKVVYVFDTISDNTPVENYIPENKDISLIKSIRFLEDWQFNENQFNKKIIVISPAIQSSFDDNTKLSFYWIKYSDFTGCFK